MNRTLLVQLTDLMIQSQLSGEAYVFSEYVQYMYLSYSYSMVSEDM